MNLKRKNSLIELFDYIFVLRPMLFFPGWSTLLAGFLIGYRNRFFITIPEIHGLDFLLIGELLLVFACAMGASFLLNQLQDVESDLHNNKLFFIAQNHISLKEAYIEVIILALFSLILAFVISVPLGLFVLSFIILTGYFYNYKPFKCKDRPWGSLAANSLMGWLAFAIGWSGTQSLSLQIIIDSMPYVFFNTALYFYTTLPDIEGDRQSKKHTLAVIYGLKSILYIAFIFYALSVISAFYLMDKQALIFILLSLPFFILTLRNKDIESAVRATKFGILFFALAICLKLPYYFILMIAGFFFTKWYFKARFDFDYPNFKGD